MITLMTPRFIAFFLLALVKLFFFSILIA
jgi:hypothetical protein